MIYIDKPPHTRGSSHLFADSITELQAFARKLGIGRKAFHNRRGKFRPHYDVRSFRVPEIVAAGATLVPWRDVPGMLRERYQLEQRIHMNIGGAMATFTQKPDQKTIAAVEALVKAVEKMGGRPYVWTPEVTITEVKSLNTEFSSDGSRAETDKTK